MAPLRPASAPAYVGALVVVGAAYYLGAKLGLNLSIIGHNVTPLWPPTGIALVAFLFLGRNQWPAIFVAALAVNIPISHNDVAAAVTAVGNVAAPLLAATLLQAVDFRRQLDRQRDALAIVFLGALLSMTVSASVGAGTLAVTDVVPADELAGAWFVWWTGDAMGVLAVAPFLLCLPLFTELPRWPWHRWAEATSAVLLVGAVTAYAATSELHALLFLTVPVLGWASWRMQLRGAAPAALAASLVATWAAAHGEGPFEHGSLMEQMLILQSFNAVVALTSFVFAALVSERIADAEALAAAAAELERRVERRTSDLSSANARLQREIRERFDAEEQLGLEHRIAQTLQRSLLPDRLPDVPGVGLAARYVPASGEAQVGGDWYDVIPLPGGQVGLAIGDVAGHGLAAAATMGQIRMAVRAYALQDPSPAAVMNGLHDLVTHAPIADMVTLLYLFYDPTTRVLRFSNAGHPPALLVSEGEADYLEEASSPPVGMAAGARYTEATRVLPPDATVLLFTDGLVERRGESLQEGFDRLVREAVAGAGDDLEPLASRLLAGLVGEAGAPDDVAVVVMRVTRAEDGPMVIRVHAEAEALVQIRRRLSRWLREAGVVQDQVDDVLVACGEICANVVQHAYGAVPGELELKAWLDHGLLEITVRDEGEWRPEADRGGGWGLQVVHSLMDSVEIVHDEAGTLVRMRRRVRIGDGA